MKKLAVTTFFLLSCATSAPLFANQQIHTGGFTGPNSAVTQNLNTVGEILNSRGMYDDMPVALTGRITRSLGGENYMFSDDTGEILVEIDHDDWYGLKTTPDTLVIINAEIDTDRGRPSLDVKRILAK